MKKNIMLILPMKLPVPAVGGGAIETLVTNLIDENELEKNAKFIIIAKYNHVASLYKYNDTKIYYFENERIIGKDFKKYRKKWDLYRIWYKCMQNHIVKGIIKKHFDYMDCFVFQCYRIAKKEHVQVVVYEGRTDEGRWRNFNKVAGCENFYNHIHWQRDDEDKVKAKEVIYNTISVSQFIKDDWCIDNNGLGRHLVVKNGIDLSQFKTILSSEERNKLQKELIINSDEIVVFYCGRIVPVKGIQVLLEAVERLQNKKIKFIVAGTPAFTSSETSDFYEEMKQKMSKYRNLVYLGFVDNHELYKYYQLSDIFVLPSLYEEAAGLVLIEAMVSGLPIIMTKTGGAVEYVTSDCSIQLDRDNNLAENISNSIIELANDKQKRIIMGNAGKKRAEEFSKKNYYKNFLQAFEI